MFWSPGLVCSLEASAAAAQPPRHAERPARVLAALEHLQECGLVARGDSDASTLRVPVRSATTEELLRARTLDALYVGQGVFIQRKHMQKRPTPKHRHAMRVFCIERREVARVF